MARLMFTLTLAFASLVMRPTFAQDMPLSMVLIEGENWQEVSSGHKFTDGATADAAGNFYFTDVLGGTKIYRVDVNKRVSVFAENAPRVSGLQFGADGKLYACQGGKFGRIVAFDQSGKLSVVAEGVKPNDLVVTYDGGIYFTETPKQQVTYISPQGTVSKVDQGISKPNGIALSPDQSTLAVSDHGGRHVWAWRIEKTGKLRFKAPYMTMRTPTPDAAARGDGMITDAAGRYYVTSAVGLQMFDPTGRMGGVIAAPQKRPLVSVAFAGPGLSYLYVACGDKIYRRKTKTKGVLYFQKPRVRARF